ncbi:isopentenyl-diphosphate Delta-isomerase [Nesterenkonia xinjiangensis]|uniref:Isopentenyl-diphosphate Delta-isomerase n=1 Tax=Nesterenkonia xinjiangensis TaxID=225327 RepID=A0A7Z0GKE7_9MICC|nr:isopentenyl-diphosphate Delta-isomerase [Nesterenkonia xinjiangensis]NYJ77590.1 isopentenyl-diphosphate delta-isomerase [Nesterenkonia xinjiangensis]
MMDVTAGHVVLLDESGEPCGSAQKSQVHTADTPLHLGFSCHLITAHGQVLVTRRALTKRTWPGVWTNSFCGHPQPEETMEEAVRRHARHELGMELDTVESALPEFRYRATDASGVVENEICPVFIAKVTAEPDPRPHPDEVAELVWVRPEQLRAAVEATPWAFSPWLVLQVPQMALYRQAPAASDVEEPAP